MTVYVEDLFDSTFSGSSAPPMAFKKIPTVLSTVYPLSPYELITDTQNQTAAASYAVSHTIFVNDNLTGTYKVVSLSAVFGTASGSATLNVEVATGTQAIASGTNQMSATVSLAGTANTVVNGTITTQTTISAGARVNLIFAGTVTSLANAAVTVGLAKLT